MRPTCVHEYDGPEGCPDCLSELYTENLKLRERLMILEERSRATDPPDRHRTPDVSFRYQSREMLMLAAAHLDPEGPSTRQDRSDMARNLRYLLKNEEHVWGICLRPHLRWVAQEVEKTLRNNDWKEDWRHCTVNEILHGLEDELRELDEALELRDRALIRLEIQDVIGFAMMLWHLVDELPVDPFDAEYMIDHRDVIDVPDPLLPDGVAAEEAMLTNGESSLD